jgi:uncharacterized protein YkwD
MRIHTIVYSLGRACLAASLSAAAACTPSVTVGSSSPGTIVTNTNGGAAADLDYRRIEREIVDELNAVRANPPAYSANISALLPYYSGTLLRRPGVATPLQTQEGAGAAREAIDALRSQVRLPALTYSVSLSNAARDLAEDQSRRGSVGHTASDGGTPPIRIARYGQWGVSYNENVNYGPFRAGRDVVVDLLIDDGVADRGHRHNIFDQSSRVVGVSCAPHPKYGSVCVIDAVGSWR